MKKILTLALLFLAHVSFSQEITIKDEKVLLEDQQILKSEKINILEYSFYSLEDDEEILYFRRHDNETKDYTDDDYFILNFPTEKIKLESTNYSRIMSGIGANSRKNMEKLLNWLLKEKVLDKDGNINKERLINFYEKYNENISERTVR